MNSDQPDEQARRARAGRLLFEKIDAAEGEGRKLSEDDMDRLFEESRLEAGLPSPWSKESFVKWVPQQETESVDKPQT